MKVYEEQQLETAASTSREGGRGLLVVAER